MCIYLKSGMSDDLSDAKEESFSGLMLEEFENGELKT